MSDINQMIEAEIPRLRLYARSLTKDVSSADDLVQDCLVRGLTKIHLWRAGTDLRAWLFTILHNQFVSRIRKAAREGTFVDIEMVDHPRLHTRAAQESPLLIEDFRRAYEQLPPGQQAVIYLISIEGMSNPAAAKFLGIPVGTVRSRLSRGRGLLRELAGEDLTKKRRRRKYVSRPRRKQTDGHPRLVVNDYGNVDRNAA